MAKEVTNGAKPDPQAPAPEAIPAPAPQGKQPDPKQKPKPKHKLSTQGRKPKTQSTQAEIKRERLTSKIIACLALGKTIQEIAKELDCSDSIVIRVRQELDPEFLEYFSQAKTNEISALIEQGIKAQLKALMKIVEVTDDELWLKAQRAPELATFFGVINDKTIRVLAAIERADERRRIEQQAISEAGAAIPGRPAVREAAQGV